MRKNVFLFIGLSLIVISILSIIGPFLPIHESYSKKDYESNMIPDPNPTFISYINMDMENINKGYLSIDFFDGVGYSWCVQDLKLKLINENDEVIWDYEGDVPIAYSYGPRSERAIIEIDKSGDYTLYIECRNINSLALVVHYTKVHPYLQFPVVYIGACCCAPILILIGLIFILTSIIQWRKDKRESRLLNNKVLHSRNCVKRKI